MITAPRPTILIVEDAPESVHVLHALLREEARVIFATDGRSALQIVERELPDLILLDIRLPDIDGYAVCRALKLSEGAKTIPIIFITDMNAEQDEAVGLSLGAVDYISKPFAPAIVQARVRNQLALSVATKELRLANLELARLASTDPLTGSHNRRHFMARGGDEVARSDRYGFPLSVVIFDIDHFKTINDSFGHAAGDQAIIATVEAASRQLRREDTLGRIGGEEFGLILPVTDLNGALTLAERVRQAISDLRLPAGVIDIRFTVSLGVTKLLNREETFDMTLKRADLALYQAKCNGRNQVVVG